MELPRLLTKGLWTKGLWNSYLALIGLHGTTTWTTKLHGTTEAVQDYQEHGGLRTMTKEPLSGTQEL